jgi:hypothetical protein
MTVAHAFDNVKLIHLRLCELVSLLFMHDISLKWVVCYLVE